MFSLITFNIFSAVLRQLYFSRTLEAGATACKSRLSKSALCSKGFM